LTRGGDGSFNGLFWNDVDLHVAVYSGTPNTTYIGPTNLIENPAPLASPTSLEISSSG